MRMLLKATLDTEKPGKVLQEGEDAAGSPAGNGAPPAGSRLLLRRAGQAKHVLRLEHAGPLRASSHTTPVMNEDDLQRGLQQAFG